MQTQTYSAAYIQKRKLYTFLPILIFPFITILYWVIGIKMIYKNAAIQAQPQGLNMKLPDPNLKDESAFSKLSFYDKAKSDSAKILEQLKKDPYRNGELSQKQITDSDMSIKGLENPDPQKKLSTRVDYKGKSYTGENQTRIIEKLKSLDAALAKSTEPAFTEKESQLLNTQKASIPNEQIDLERLEAVMLKADNTQESHQQDPEMTELNQMLEKILDIQHPERVADRLKNQNLESGENLNPVVSVNQQTPINSFGQSSTDSSVIISANQEELQGNGFFSLDDSVISAEQNAIKAVVHESQTLVSGSTIKLRLTSDVYIAGTLIPKDSFVYGIANVNAERLLVDITSIRLNSSLFNVKLSVFDLDGQPGIYIPGSISRNVAKQSMSQDISGLSIGSLDPSIGAQAASAGIQAAKTLLGRKTKLVQVTVKAGYQILLKDGNLKQL